MLFEGRFAALLDGFVTRPQVFCRSDEMVTVSDQNAQRHPGEVGTLSEDQALVMSPVTAVCLEMFHCEKPCVI